MIGKRSRNAIVLIALAARDARAGSAFGDAIDDVQNAVLSLPRLLASALRGFAELIRGVPEIIAEATDMAGDFVEYAPAELYSAVTAPTTALDNVREAVVHGAQAVEHSAQAAFDVAKAYDVTGMTELAGNSAPVGYFNQIRNNFTDFLRSYGFDRLLTIRDDISEPNVEEPSERASYAGIGDGHPGNGSRPDPTSRNGGVAGKMGNSDGTAGPAGGSGALFFRARAGHGCANLIPAPKTNNGNDNGESTDDGSRAPPSFTSAFDNNFASRSNDGSVQYYSDGRYCGGLRTAIGNGESRDGSGGSSLDRATVRSGTQGTTEHDAPLKNGFQSHSGQIARVSNLRQIRQGITESPSDPMEALRSIVNSKVRLRLVSFIMILMISGAICAALLFGVTRFLVERRKAKVVEKCLQSKSLKRCVETREKQECKSTPWWQKSYADAGPNNSCGDGFNEDDHCLDCAEAWHHHVGSAEYHCNRPKNRCLKVAADTAHSSMYDTSSHLSPSHFSPSQPSPSQPSPSQPSPSQLSPSAEYATALRPQPSPKTLDTWHLKAKSRKSTEQLFHVLPPALTNQNWREPTTCHRPGKEYP